MLADAPPDFVSRLRSAYPPGQGVWVNVQGRQDAGVTDGITSKPVSSQVLHARLGVDVALRAEPQLRAKGRRDGLLTPPERQVEVDQEGPVAAPQRGKA